MLRKHIKTLLLSILYLVVGTALGLCLVVLVCDVWRLGWGICR